MMMSLEHICSFMLGNFVQVSCDQKSCFKTTQRSFFDVERLNSHDFKRNHVKGKNNRDAGFLSRYVFLNDEMKEKGRDVVKREQKADLLTEIHQKFELEIQN